MNNSTSTARSRSAQSLFQGGRPNMPVKTIAKAHSCQPNDDGIDPPLLPIRSLAGYKCMTAFAGAAVVSNKATSIRDWNG
jgi:hypothetical protein